MDASVERVRAKISACVHARLASGIAVKTGMRGYYFDAKYPMDPLCLLGAIGVTSTGYGHAHNQAATILGISVEEAFALEAGFEDWRKGGYVGPLSEEFYELGKEFRLTLGVDDEE